MKLKDIKPTDVQRALNAMEGADIWQWFNGLKNMKKERMYIQFSLFLCKNFQKIKIAEKGMLNGTLLFVRLMEEDENSLP